MCRQRCHRVGGLFICLLGEGQRGAWKHTGCTNVSAQHQAGEDPPPINPRISAPASPYPQDLHCGAGLGLLST